MPELPEVETFRRRFLHGIADSPILVGEQISGATVLWEKTLATPALEIFREQIQGQIITDIGRRAKYLLVHLSTDVLIVHLRMSGDLVVEPEAAPIAKHHRVLLHFESGIRLAFNDTRKFGRVWLVDDVRPWLSHLGPEPLDSTFTPEILFEKLQTRQRQIKPLLLDQAFLAGLGNIYTDEALFLAKIHPQTVAKSLSFAQTTVLWNSIRTVLSEGIRRNGASIDWVYRGGSFQNQFQVYQRNGQRCYLCQTPIQRIIVGQRSTHYCPQCQHIGG